MLSKYSSYYNVVALGAKFQAIFLEDIIDTLKLKYSAVNDLVLLAVDMTFKIIKIVDYRKCKIEPLLFVNQ